MLVGIVLLVAAGTLLGLSTIIAKIAGDVGLPPVGFLAWALLGASCILFGNAIASGHRPALNRRTLEYFIISAFVTVAGSNLIFFSAVPVVGVGFVSLAITLPPLLTYVGALLFKLERFSVVRLLGVLAALFGAALLAIGEVTAPDAPIFWIILTLVGPVLLAVGNLYRTLRWPPGASAEELAPGMLMAATLMLFAAGLLPQLDLFLNEVKLHHAGLIALQACVFAGQFLLMFLLQKACGPMLLSFLGAVAAMVSVPIAIYVLGESVPRAFLPGSLLIVVGIIAFNIRSQRAGKPNNSMPEL